MPEGPVAGAAGGRRQAERGCALPRLGKGQTQAAGSRRWQAGAAASGLEPPVCATCITATMWQPRPPA